MASGNERLETVFPGLRGTAYRVTSPPDDRYNCIAWAAGETNRWWWPGDPAGTHWPVGVPRLETLAAFCQAFATLGYVHCAQAERESGHEKIALFADANGLPTHAARQLSSGRWTSKLGALDDLEHDLHDLVGGVYGSVVQVMKRPAPVVGGEMGEPMTERPPAGRAGGPDQPGPPAGKGGSNPLLPE